MDEDFNYDSNCATQPQGVYGVKGFTRDLKCRDFQYEIGKTYTMDEDPKLCKRGFHFCETLKQVYVYYSQVDSNRYCVILAAGKIEKDNDKSCCNKITILRELTLEERGILEEGLNLFFIKGMSDLGYVIGGSLGLKMQGYDLKRPISDIDFSCPTDKSHDISDIFSLRETLSSSFKDVKNGGDDVVKAYMDHAYNVKYDILRSDKSIVKKVVYKGIEFLVQDALQILTYKAKYAFKGSKKHYDDLKMLNVNVTFNLEIKPTTPAIYSTDDLPF